MLQPVLNIYIPCPFKFDESGNLVSEDGLVSDKGDIRPVELADVVRLRGVKCPVSAGPGGPFLSKAPPGGFK